jgi:hypothetical protein
MGAYLDPDRAIAALAARQYGVVTRDQLSDLGLGRGAIGRRLSTGDFNGCTKGCTRWDTPRRGGRRRGWRQFWRAARVRC